MCGPTTSMRGREEKKKHCKSKNKFHFRSPSNMENWKYFRNAKILLQIVATIMFLWQVSAALQVGMDHKVPQQNPEFALDRRDTKLACHPPAPYPALVPFSYTVNPKCVYYFWTICIIVE